MDVRSLLPELKQHARIDTASEDSGLELMLETAAADVAHAGNITLPEHLSDLPDDLLFAIIDQAAKTYDQRAADEAKPGLSLAASRIVHRYRGVGIGFTETEAEADG